VDRHGVPGGRDLRCERGIPFDLLSAEEEDRRRAARAERLEHRRRPLRMRPVVEGQRNGARAVDSPRQAEQLGDARHDRRERG
jgi:hypothetical protein